MNKIDRYILGLFWLYFLGGLIVFITLFVAVSALSEMTEYHNIDAMVWLRYYGYGTPEIVYRMVPLATVMSIVFTLSTLNRASELVAMYSIGMSLFRVATPMLCAVLVLCGAELAIGDRVLPNFAKNKNYILATEIKKNPSLYSMVKTDRIWYRSHDTIFNIKTLNAKAHTAQGLMLYYFNENWDLLQMISAKTVDMASSNWVLRDGSVTVFAEDSSFPVTSQFKQKSIVMTEDAGDLSSSPNTSDVLSLSDLNQYIKKNKEAGLDTVRYEVDLQSKYSYSIAALVMALLGIPFSVSRSRSGGAMMNVGICLGLIFVFWIFYSSSLALGNYGKVPPMMAAWAPMIIMGGIAVALIRRRGV